MIFFLDYFVQVDKNDALFLVFNCSSNLLLIYLSHQTEMEISFAGEQVIRVKFDLSMKVNDYVEIACVL